MTDSSHRTINLYQSSWPEKFKKEEVKLRKIFGNKAVAIEHIGSTSITGLSSKPIIDIAVLIENKKDADNFVPLLSGIGYREDVRSTERHFFKKGTPTEFHLSIAYMDAGGFWARQIMFRDFLRDHSDVRQEYNTLKRGLLIDDPTGGDEYISGKSDFINRILKIAKENGYSAGTVKEIKSTLTNRSGQILDVIYREDDPLKDLDGKILQGVHAYCFCGDKLAVVYSEAKKYWTPPGGGIEPGETYEQAVVREVKEETNMKVISQKLIGYQDIYEKDRIVRQTRSVCMVEPIGDFKSDPDGDVTEIKLINPADYKKYFDWGVIGDRIMEQALEMRKVITRVT